MRFLATLLCLFLLLLFYARGHSLNGPFSTASKSQGHPDDIPNQDDKMDDESIDNDDKLMNGSDEADTDDDNDNDDDGEDDDGEDDNGDDDGDNIPKAEANLGKHYFQGDMLTTKDQIGKINDLLYHVSSTSRNQPQLRALIKDVSRTWKNGVVPYTIQDNVDVFAKGITKKAIEHWETKTCLRFKKRTDEKDYVQFVGREGCASYVGRIGGKQNIIVGNTRRRCKVGNIIHEIGHSIGFFHEQSRPDRNNFVKIRWKNVLRDYRVNFVKFSSSVIDSKEVSYDYGSIMHYPRRIFGKVQSEPTVVPVDNNAKIGQRIALSEKDILQAKKMYNCK